MMKKENLKTPTKNNKEKLLKKRILSFNMDENSSDNEKKELNNIFKNTK